ncbi:uncharacterized protein LOC111898387 isoform X1 [Lactuca sativa]|uniref:Coactivator CBP, KIX domain-containing protein n=2 Tax=Lactuca sativa TaxID=4236 RepID=A0A9R1VHT1_LACSA|nr:uncharacterized protein LOC111898387 isoform X1 [Lactuca sativa]KAJ0205005.1 hypothetical protein LSAT_V11C500239470 [Lactuca sativa]
MPRPGPRPYECVRRAWHSDRHQPMRGSLIQEIFRIVTEIHSSATRKNKEWQDKLPIVVLKAEEIMYSKANSEAEYMNLETLWERANDAINTIIRLDESTETGDFLQPCIEAALNLGCTPMRTSRSQRNNTSTYYLNIKNPDSNFCPSNNLHKCPQENPIKITQFAPHYPQIMNPRVINVPPFNLKPQIPIPPNETSIRNKFPFQSQPNTKSPSVYPLFYGNGNEPMDPKMNYSEIKENRKLGLFQKPCFSEEHDDGHECDLSLRLGPSNMKTSQQSRNLEVGEFEKSNQWSFEGEKVDLDGRMRKRKAVVGNLYENLQFCWQSKVSSANSNGGL